MDEVQEVEAKILYSSLKHLTDEERQFLADKYRVEKRPRKPQMSDKEMAAKYNISSDQYAHKRWKIEVKLKRYINENVDKFKEERSKAFDIVRGINRTEKQKREAAEFIEWVNEQAKERHEAYKRYIEEF